MTGTGQHHELSTVVLRTEKEIMDSWNGSIENPYVSICCITYNHEEFVEDALIGFLMQETDFPFEIIIHDDASTDNTQSIIAKYAARYPRIIKTIFQEVNQYAKGISPATYYIQHLRGKYVAYCEGDDYWTDPHKLHKQTEFLERNPDYVACYHNVRVVGKDKQELFGELNIYPYKGDHTVSFENIEQIELPGQTASVVYRNHWITEGSRNIDLFLRCKVNGDMKLAVMLGVKGRIFFMSDVMADHRRVIEGGESWSARNHGKNLSKDLFNNIVYINDFIHKAYGIELKNKRKRYLVVTGALYHFIKSGTKEDRRVLISLIEELRGERLGLCLFFILHTLKWPFRKIIKRGKGM